MATSSSWNDYSSNTSRDILCLLKPLIDHVKAFPPEENSSAELSKGDSPVSKEQQPKKKPQKKKEKRKNSETKEKEPSKKQLKTKEVDKLTFDNFV